MSSGIMRTRILVLVGLVAWMEVLLIEGQEESRASDAAAEVAQKAGSSVTNALVDISPRRPRTLAEARQQRARQADVLASCRSNGIGSTDAAGWMEVLDARLFVLIEERWRQLIADAPVMPAVGRVDLEFDLASVGQVRGLDVTRGEENALLGILCQRAVLDLVPISLGYSRAQERRADEWDHVTIRFHYRADAAASMPSSLRRLGSQLLFDISYPPAAVPRLAEAPSRSWAERYVEASRGEVVGFWPWGWDRFCTTRFEDLTERNDWRRSWCDPPAGVDPNTWRNRMNSLEGGKCPPPPPPPPSSVVRMK